MYGHFLTDRNMTFIFYCPSEEIGDWTTLYELNEFILVVRTMCLRRFYFTTCYVVLSHTVGQYTVHACTHTRQRHNYTTDTRMRNICLCTYVLYNPQFFFFFFRDSISHRCRTVLFIF